MPDPTFEENLRNALAYVEVHGFGEDVDMDSLIEEAAERYLDLMR